MDAVGGDVHKEVSDKLSVDIRLAELDTLIVIPLRRDDVADHIPVPSGSGRPYALSDEVADQVPTREHVCVRPFELRRRVVHPRVQAFPPHAAHLVKTKIGCGGTEDGVQPVVCADLRLGRARDVRHKPVLSDPLGCQPTEVIFLAAHGLLEPFHGILLFPAKGPLRLIDDQLDRVFGLDAVAPSV